MYSICKYNDNLTNDLVADVRVWPIKEKSINNKCFNTKICFQNYFNAQTLFLVYTLDQNPWQTRGTLIIIELVQHMIIKK